MIEPHTVYQTATAEPHLLAVRYVVATTAMCRHCGEEHGYTTRGCGVLIVYTRAETAIAVARQVGGDPLPITELPDRAHFILETR